MPRRNKYQMRTPVVALGYIHPGLVRHEFTDSLLGVAEVTPFAFRLSASSPRPATSRNLLIQDFLARGAEWLFMVDTDMSFPRDTLQRLLATAAKQAPERPIAVSAVNYAWDANTAELTPVTLLYDPVEDRYLGSDLYPDDGKPFRIDATGPACMVVHRKILEDIKELNETPPSYWFYDLCQDGWFTGNDLTFCDRLRRAGYELWVDPEVTTGHVKSITFDKRMYRARREQRFGF